MLMLAFSAGVLAFFLMRSQTCEPTATVLLDSTPELAWIQTELKLTDDQLSKATALHKAYRPTCMEMCARIATARKAMDTLAADPTASLPELNAAVSNYGAIQVACQQAMLDHFYSTAKLFNPQQSARYLKLMLPYALQAEPCTCGRSHGH